MSSVDSADTKKPLINFEAAASLVPRAPCLSESAYENSFEKVTVSPAGPSLEGLSAGLCMEQSFSVSLAGRFVSTVYSVMGAGKESSGDCKSKL